MKLTRVIILSLFAMVMVACGSKDKDEAKQPQKQEKLKVQPTLTVELADMEKEYSAKVLLPVSKDKTQGQEFSATLLSNKDNVAMETSQKDFQPQVFASTRGEGLQVVVVGYYNGSDISDEPGMIYTFVKNESHKFDYTLVSTVEGSLAEETLEAEKALAEIEAFMTANEGVSMPEAMSQLISASKEAQDKAAEEQAQIEAGQGQPDQAPQE